MRSLRAIRGARNRSCATTMKMPAACWWISSTRKRLCRSARCAPCARQNRRLTQIPLKDSHERAMPQNRERLNIFIATPLEEAHVARIRTVAPDKVTVTYEPDLLPPTRYVADHNGLASFKRTAEQEARWRQNLAKADILWDFPPDAADGTSGIALAPKVKW